MGKCLWCQHIHLCIWNSGHSPDFGEEKKMHCALREVCPAGIVALHLFCRQRENIDVKSGDINKKCTFPSLFQKKNPIKLGESERSG